MTIAELYKLFLQHPVVTTDTRDCPVGSMFFALRGTTFNGNAFALKALESGCAYAVVDDESVTGNDHLIHVDDVLTTLQHLATYHRHQLNMPVLQITGTNGKTTTKELTSAVLAAQYNVLYTQGNFNNHIGVCYVSEYGLSDLEEYRERGKDLSDDEIVAKGIGSTYDSIIEECEERWGELNDAQGEVYDLDQYAEFVFDKADWAYVSTIIDQMTN